MHLTDAIRQRDLGRAPMNFTATAKGTLDVGGREVRCALGKGGVKPAAEKR